MSTLTQAQPATAVPGRLLTVPLAATFLAEFTSLTSFFLLLSVMPMLAAASGASSSGAGLLTGSLLLGTVAAEATATAAIRRFGYRMLIGQLPEAKASALWNLAYDAGYGAGPAVFGLICVRTGYPAAFGLTGALILAAVPGALRERKAAASAARPA
jgi:hypothetical protein